METVDEDETVVAAESLRFGLACARLELLAVELDDGLRAGASVAHESVTIGREEGGRGGPSWKRADVGTSADLASALGHSGLGGPRCRQGQAESTRDGPS